MTLQARSEVETDDGEHDSYVRFAAQRRRRPDPRGATASKERILVPLDASAAADSSADIGATW